MTIYLDIIFLENLFMNYIILFATGIIVRAPLKIIRTLISSILGSIYAIISYISILEIYSSLFLKIILSISMVYIAFGSKNVKIFFKQLIIFYLTSFTFGGVAFAFLYLISPQNILLEDGVLIGTYPIKVILTAGIVGFIIITTSFKNIKGKLTKKDMYCQIKVNINMKHAYINAIIDTGNFLREPITKIPVVVIEKEILYGIIPSYILDNINKIINGEDIDLMEYTSKIRIIPFTSLGKENGILLGLKADSVLVEMEENNININNVIIGIYDGHLNKTGKYKALIGVDFLDYKENVEIVV